LAAVPGGVVRGGSYHLRKRESPEFGGRWVPKAPSQFGKALSKKGGDLENRRKKGLTEKKKS